MAINLTDLLGTTTISSMRQLVNANFDDVEIAVNSFLDIYDSLGGNIDLTGNTNGILKAKKLEIPTGNQGIVVGSSTLTDTALSTAQVTTSNIFYNTTSIQYVTFSTNLTALNSATLAIVDNARTLILDPTTAALEVELAISSGNKMRELNILNLSQTNDTLQFNITATWIDNGGIITITMPVKQNLKLGYINDANTNTQGWYVISQNGCTIV